MVQFVVILDFEEMCYKKAANINVQKPYQIYQRYHVPL